MVNVTKLQDTCACILNMTTKSMIKPCRTHKTFRESMTHNLSFKNRSEEQKETERNKPQFRRR